LRRRVAGSYSGVDRQEELLDNILHGYGLAGLFRMVLQMDGSMMVRIPQRVLSSVAA
jgi:hypothetical protein